MVNLFGMVFFIECMIFKYLPRINTKDFFFLYTDKLNSFQPIFKIIEEILNSLLKILISSPLKNYRMAQIVC